MGAHKYDSDRLVKHGFFEPLGLKWKDCEEKIHLFYGVIKLPLFWGVLTDYIMCVLKCYLNVKCSLSIWTLTGWSLCIQEKYIIPCRCQQCRSSINTNDSSMLQQIQWSQKVCFTQKSGAKIALQWTFLEKGFHLSKVEPSFPLPHKKLSSINMLGCWWPYTPKVDLLRGH